jgi:type I restriction enzyme M protein
MSLPSMKLKDNGFNLNIPRYVDTFEEEEIINLEEVKENIDLIKERSY